MVTMALFKPKTDGERELNDLVSRKDMLKAKLAATDRDLAQALDDRRRALLEADFDSPSAEPVSIARLRDERDALIDAISRIDAKIADAERRIAADRDRQARERQVADRRQQIEAAQIAAQDFAAAGERLVEKLQPLAPVSLAAGAAASNTKYLTDQLGLGVAAGLAEANSYVARVASGTVAIVAEPIRIAPAPPALDVERIAVMLFQASRWNEPNGVTDTGARNGIVKLPVAVAERACARNLAVRIDSERYRKLRASEVEPYGQQWARPLPQDTVVDLDHPEAPATAPEKSPWTDEWVGPPTIGVAIASPARR
jgi:hypothetical protein